MFGQHGLTGCEFIIMLGTKKLEKTHKPTVFKILDIRQ